MLGNSYANPRIPLDATNAANFSGVGGLDITDISHETNARIWDDFYFSTLGLDYQSATGSAFDNVFAYQQTAFALPNPRLLFVPEPGDQSIDGFIGTAAGTAPRRVFSRVRIAGAFNVNSTSKNAWKAVLSSMGASELPRINPAQPTAAPSWERPEGTRFNRFGHVSFRWLAPSEISTPSNS